VHLARVGLNGNISTGFGTGTANKGKFASVYKYIFSRLLQKFRGINKIRFLEICVQ
jgi:hypothetical protein